MSTSLRASMKLTFLVIGGGLAGLSTAYALQNAGHDVVIIEQNLRKRKTEGTIRAPPNMTRILRRWPGMAAFLEMYGTICSGISFRSGETSEPVGFMKFHDQIMTDLQANFLVIQHEPLCQHLTSLCCISGVVFKHAIAVNIIKLVNGGVTVALGDGEVLRGDIVVGADGHNSFVRDFVMEEVTEPESVVPGVNIAISTHLMMQNEEFRPLCEENQFTIWMGNGSTMTGVLDNTSETFNLGICSPNNSVGPLIFDGDWYENRDLTHLQAFNLSGYDPRLRKLIELGHTCQPTVQKLFEPADVVGLDGTVALVGDAAHSVLIHGSHNSSMAIEDAVTLGTLFSHLTNRKQIPVFLATYEELRQARTSATHMSEYQSLLQISLPPGEEQAARDEALKLTLSKEFEDFENCASSEMLVQAWEQYLVLFSHDASEEVDNWWSKWNFTVR